MTLRAILFDLDGTLADTESHGHRPAYNTAFKELGLPFQWGAALYRKLLHQPSGRERLMHYLHQHQPELGEHAEAVGEHPEAWVEHVHALKSLHFKQRLHQGQVPLRPGVARLIAEAAAAGVRMAVVTNASSATVKSFLEVGVAPALAKELALVISPGLSSKPKPAPDLYLQALAKLKLPPYQCVAIEDSEIGVLAAQAAGIPVVATVNDLTRHQNFAAASLVLDCLGEPQQAAKVLKGQMHEPCLSLLTLEHIAKHSAPRL